MIVAQQTCEVVLVFKHITPTHGEVKIKLHAFLTSGVRGHEWQPSASAALQ
jgi:hypothetical protein